MDIGDHPLLRTLRGGDRRSIGRADAAARAALADSACAEVLWLGLLGATDPVVRMRCADALEKCSRLRPDLVHARRASLLRLAQAPQPKELRWHLMQMLPRAAWAPQECALVLAVIQAALRDASAIVKVGKPRCGRVRPGWRLRVRPEQCLAGRAQVCAACMEHLPA